MSKLVIGHLQELRVHIPDGLSLGVEQELVAAVTAQIAMTAAILFQRHKCMESLRGLKLGETPLGTEAIGRKLADAKLDCLFLFGSSAAKMCTVPCHWTRR